VHNLERRFITQGEQLRAIGESTERLMAGGVRLKGGSAPAASDEKFLHPDVENFLKPADTHWPPPGATLHGELKRGWPTGDPKGFNSLLESFADLSEYIEAYAALSLASRNSWTDPGVWHGELAHRVEVTNDFKEFTIYLKKGVLWHPPANVDVKDPKYAWLKGSHEVTAEDMVFTFDMILHPQVENGSLKNYYAELESAKAVDSHTLVVRWRKKQYLNLGATLGMFPLPKFMFAFDADGKPFSKETAGLRFNQHWYNNKGFIGAGPYRMESYQPGSKIRLVRNEAFAGDKPAIAAINYPIYTDPQQTLLKLKAHELSFGELKAGQYREEILRFEGKAKPTNSPFFDGRISCQQVPSPSFDYLGWNADRPIFADKRVRRAMTQAFDRPRILESVFVGSR
jgi:peptide/nickel transport system substrate-binding protein